MKTLLLALLLIGQMQLGVFESRDRFEDTVTLQVRLSLPQRGPGFVLMSVAASGKGDKLIKRPPAVTVILFSRSDSWLYNPSGNEWRLLLDGKERIILGTANRSVTDVRSGYVLEGLSLEQIPLETIEKIAHAKTVEMRINTIEFQLKPDHLEQIKEFLSRLPPR